VDKGSQGRLPVAYYLRGARIESIDRARSPRRALPRRLVIPPGTTGSMADYTLKKEGLYRFLYPYPERITSNVCVSARAVRDFSDLLEARHGCRDE